MFSTKVDVRYCDTDKMGIVYHARYFYWFEVARDAFIKAFGISYFELEKIGIMMPVVDCSSRFRKGAQYGDTVTVYIEIKKLGVAKCEFLYRVVREADGILLAEGTTKHGFVGNDFKPINLKKKYPKVYNIFENMRGGVE